MNPDAIMTPVIQYGFAGAFAVTLAALLTLVWYVINKLLQVVNENTKTNQKLIECIDAQKSKQETTITLLDRVVKDMYQRPCLKDRA